MRFSELVLTFSGLFLDLGLLASCLVDIFPGGPILLVLAEVLPHFFSSGEMLSQQHDVSRNEEEGVNRFRIACSLGLLLRILERVDVLRDALHVQMLVLYLVLKCKYIEGMEDTT